MEAAIEAGALAQAFRAALRKPSTKLLAIDFEAPVLPGSAKRLPKQAQALQDLHLQHMHMHCFSSAALYSPTL